ncbi:hypothetical protein C478_10451 [Natrinema thermotolerans DSM 11552]|nr:hypothetical protein C478_10451 [Natrinema thermotolerans DSM 11552]
MSSSADVVDPQNLDITRYTQGDDRYVRYAEEILGLELADTQKRILRAVAKHRRLIVMSANGVGKSYTATALKHGFLETNLDSTALGTSGSYSQFEDAVWRPLKKLHKEAKQRLGLPGETYDGGQPRLEIDDDWFAKIVSPRDPGDLEGRHAADVLVVIEEADKKYITAEHFDSAGSSVTDGSDRMLAVCNPPRDETNVVAEKLESNRWHVIQFSSFESHNVLVDAGELDADHIPGLVDLPTIAEDWEDWNSEPWPEAPTHWDGDYPGVAMLNDRVEAGDLEREDVIEILRPGFDEARQAHDRREDLDERWYRRRAGIIPPAGAEKNRPFDLDAVDSSYVPPNKFRATGPRCGTGVDVARSGDRTVQIDERKDQLDVAYSEPGTDHTVQFNTIWDNLDEEPNATISIDAIGEGSGKADDTAARYPDVDRFKAGEEAAQSDEYKDRWTEGLCELGNWLEAGGTFSDSRLRRELQIAARTLTLEENYYASRGDEVYVADPKSKVEDRLGHSPDHLDAAIMAVLASKGVIPEDEDDTTSGTGTW